MGHTPTVSHSGGCTASSVENGRRPRALNRRMQRFAHACVHRSFRREHERIVAFVGDESTKLRTRKGYKWTRRSSLGSEREPLPNLRVDLRTDGWHYACIVSGTPMMLTRRASLQRTLRITNFVGKTPSEGGVCGLARAGRAREYSNTTRSQDHWPNHTKCKRPCFDTADPVSPRLDAVIFAHLLFRGFILPWWNT